MSGLGTCASVCIRLTRWIPAVFIIAIVVWSYYAYVVYMCIGTIENVGQKVIYLALYHPFLFMFMWAMWRTVFTEIGQLPDQYYLPAATLDAFEAAQTDDRKRDVLEAFTHSIHFPILNRSATGSVRYCDVCKAVKPDRAHHDSVSGECVLKMDHYCPWVNNTVGFTSYKFFVLFLLYSLLYCLYVALTTLPLFIDFWTTAGGSDMGRFNILFLFFISAMFCISLTALLAYHVYLTAQNKTTLESFRAPIMSYGVDKHAFSLGCAENFRQVFGRDAKFWLLPVYSSAGNGCSFPVRSPKATSFNQHRAPAVDGSDQHLLDPASADTDLEAAAHHRSGRNGAPNGYGTTENTATADLVDETKH